MGNRMFVGGYTWGLNESESVEFRNSGCGYKGA